MQVELEDLLYYVRISFDRGSHLPISLNLELLRQLRRLHYFDRQVKDGTLVKNPQKQQSSLPLCT